MGGETHQLDAARPPQRRDVLELLKHAQKVHHDDSSQHSLRGNPRAENSELRFKVNKEK